MGVFKTKKPTDSATEVIRTPLPPPAPGSAIGPDRPETFAAATTLIPAGMAGSVRLNGGVMAIMQIPGATEALLDAFEAYDAEHPERPAGQLVHLAAGTPNGITIYDIWQSVPLLEAWLTDTPGQLRPEIVTLHAVRISRDLDGPPADSVRPAESAVANL
jgi:hypothetical protein